MTIPIPSEAGWNRSQGLLHGTRDLELTAEQHGFVLLTQAGPARPRSASVPRARAPSARRPARPD